MFKRIKTTLVACAAGAVVTATVALAATATPAMAYGKANWQTTFAATATFPGGGGGFGFWGWCDFAGGVTATSGTSGDCQVTQYGHTPTGGGFTCHENVNVTSWVIAPSSLTGLEDFFITGSLTVTPTALTDACVAVFPMHNPFSGVDTGIPGAAGHYPFGVDRIPGGVPPGTVGEYNVTVTQVP